MSLLHQLKIRSTTKCAEERKTTKQTLSRSSSLVGHVVRIQLISIIILSIEQVHENIIFSCSFFLPLRLLLLCHFIHHFIYRSCNSELSFSSLFRCRMKKADLKFILFSCVKKDWPWMMLSRFDYWRRTECASWLRSSRLTEYICLVHQRIRHSDTHICICVSHIESSQLNTD